MLCVYAHNYDLTLQSRMLPEACWLCEVNSVFLVNKTNYFLLLTVLPVFASGQFT